MKSFATTIVTRRDPFIVLRNANGIEIDESRQTIQALCEKLGPNHSCKDLFLVVGQGALCDRPHATRPPSGIQFYFSSPIVGRIHRDHSIIGDL
jgi:hypothetical protein